MVSLQLNSADVRLLVRGLAAWIEQPMTAGFMSVVGHCLLSRADEPDLPKLRERHDEAAAKKLKRAGQVKELLAKFSSTARMQFTVADLLQLELGLDAYCAELDQVHLAQLVTSRLMLGIKPSEQEMAEATQEQQTKCQQRRLQVCPTAYKLVMAINAASEHEGVKC